MQPTINPTSKLAQKLQKKSLKGNIIIVAVSILLVFAVIFASYRKHYVEAFYMLNSNETSYTFKAPKTNKKTVKVPTKFKGLPITNLGNWAYGDSKNLTEIKIPETITSLGDNSFRNCPALTKIEIPSSVTSIGINSFYLSGFYNNESNWEDGALYVDGWLVAVKKSETKRTVNIKEGTVGICDQLFKDRNDIESITIPDSVVYLGRETFKDCNFLTSIVIGSGVKEIGAYMFSGCDLIKSIEIPASVTTIGKYAFEDCLNLTQIYFENPYGWFCSAGEIYFGAPMDNANDNATNLTDSWAFYTLTKEA